MLAVDVIDVVGVVLGVGVEVTRGAGTAADREVVGDGETEVRGDVGVDVDAYGSSIDTACGGSTIIAATGEAAVEGLTRF